MEFLQLLFLGMKAFVCAVGFVLTAMLFFGLVGIISTIAETVKRTFRRDDKDET